MNPRRIYLPKMKKRRIERRDEEEEDRLSSLPDEVIHRIQSFLGARQAVQTSVLSRRWKHIWSTLPFLTLDYSDQLFPYTHHSIIMFMDNLFLKRSHQTRIFSFNIFAVYPFPPTFIKKLINCLNEHNIQQLHIDLYVHRYSPFQLSTFNSNSIEKLELCVPLDFTESLEFDCLWDLPKLTTLYLICPPHMSNYELSKSSLLNLPVLTTLCLDRVELPESLSSFSLPNLTTLIMRRCKLPETVWDTPALLSIELNNVLFPESTTDFFSAFVNLRDLTLNLTDTVMKDCFISCPQLVNLRIITIMSTRISFDCKIVVMTPKLHSLYCVGILPVTLNVEELENVNVKLLDTNGFMNAPMYSKLNYYHRMLIMFAGLGRSKNLTLDSFTIEALSTLFDLGKYYVSSPFHDLKYVKLPQGYKESSMSTTLRKYLLGGNPRATIV
ncbi:uncharacterized protein LOC141697778 [Apium graveolens]|uniref:uncharacterized protein LOC141697778 n=1 Tax=Apium graveolens TaxID=4045 RepID=UPI003D7BB3A1